MVERVHAPSVPAWLQPDIQHLLVRCIQQSAKNCINLLERFDKHDTPSPRTNLDKLMGSLISHSYMGTEEELRLLNSVRELLIHSATIISNEKLQQQ